MTTKNITRQGVATPSGEAEDCSLEEAKAIVASWQNAYPNMPIFGLHQVAIALAEGVKKLERERSAAIDDLCRWRSAIQRLTPGGSEYMSPNAVIEYAESRRRRFMSAMLRLKKTERELKIAIKEIDRLNSLLAQKDNV